ncbi:MAG: hypothetical protein QXJ97_03215 [Desulfurococcaceae archaeon]
MSEEKIDISSVPFVMRVVGKCRQLLSYLRKNKSVEVFLAGILCGYSPSYFRNSVLPVLRYVYSGCLILEKGKLYWVCKE